MLSELDVGPVTATEARTLSTSKGFMPMALYIDAKSVYAAITATCIKSPTDKALLCHILHIRELLDHRVLSSLIWLDTRDLTADGLTKGAVPREALHVMQDGHMHISHECCAWVSKGVSQFNSSSIDAMIIRHCPHMPVAISQVGARLRAPHSPQ
jgi:hypothetical protein